MANAIFFSATVQKSPMSIPARVMTEQGLNRVVYFVLRGGSDEQRAYLYELLGMSLASRVPLRKARREMLICRCVSGVSMQAHIEDYNALLQHVFGEKCRIRVRILFGVPSATHSSCDGWRNALNGRFEETSRGQGCTNGSVGTSLSNPCDECEGGEV